MNQSVCESLENLSVKLACLSVLKKGRKKRAADDRLFEQGSFAFNGREFFFTDELELEIQKIRDWCSNENAKIIYPGHPDYPACLLRLKEPPLFLTVLGEPSWKFAPAISVVGSREPSSHSLNWMETHFSDFLLATQAVTVSGGARGVDQKTHTLSLRSRLPTVVFLPSGLASPYPPEIGDWIQEIKSSGGAVLSPFHPFQTIRREHFEGRNRLIAAMGAMVFVVEARRRSGTIMTARLARELDKTICVLPSFPSDPRAAGSLDLIFDGALPVRDSLDLRTLFDLSRVSAMPFAE